MEYVFCSRVSNCAYIPSNILHLQNFATDIRLYILSYTTNLYYNSIQYCSFVLWQLRDANVICALCHFTSFQFYVHRWRIYSYCPRLCITLDSDQPKPHPLLRRRTFRSLIGSRLRTASVIGRQSRLSSREAETAVRKHYRFRLSPGAGMRKAEHGLGMTVV